MVPPDRFIGIAEDSGLIVGIGAWVLTKACLAAQQWNRESGRELKIAVNLSARQFALDDLVATVSSALSITGCEPRWLELEITESLLLGDNERVRETLQTFREMGITIAIDDFGTGYSALGYLKRFPIDVLKIDRSFIRDVMIDHDSTELVKAIIHMARSLNLELVAEGVETETHETFLRTHGCQLAQGYFYSKPVPAQEFNALPMLASAPSASVTAI
jgi:EAL domain-containing protein (putative c-di-GMP-specific phosphodiesterase class I)